MTQGLKGVRGACGCRVVQMAGCPLLGGDMYLRRYRWVLGMGAELVLSVQVCGHHGLVNEPVLLIACPVSLHKGLALGSAEGAGMSQVWKALSLEQRRVWWVTALGVLAGCARQQQGDQDTWTCGALMDVNQPQGACGDGDSQETSKKEAEGCWGYPRISGMLL